MLEHGAGLGLRNRREVLEKVGKGMAALEVIEERFDRYASPPEDGRSAENLRIRHDGETTRRHVEPA